MGALTSKPYAFVARSWEVERVDCIDFFDVFGSSLFVELRGFDVVRVLPKINYLVNGEWLSDRARSFFDGLKYQRLLRPLIKIGLSFSYCSWFFVHKLFFFFKKLLNFFFNSGSLSIIFFSDFLAGEDEDLFRLVSFDFILKFFGN
jgi:NADH dehydrogenase/NADH:ubiquinone oxidoreductase subunit G